MSDDLAGEMQAAVEAGGGSPPPAGAPPERADPSPRVTDGGEPQQTKPDGTASAAPKPQYVPVDEHKRVVDGFHKRLDAMGWAAKLDPDRVTKAIDFFDRFERDPAAIWRDHQETLRGAEAPAPDLQSEDGYALYSAEQAAALADWKVTQALQAFEHRLDQRFTPLLQSHEEGQRWTRAGSQMEPYLDQPWFAENAEAITTALADARASGSPLSLEQAILQVMTPHWLQDDAVRMAKAREAVLAELDTTHADASQAVSARRPASTVRRVEDTPTAELIEEELKRRRTA